MYVDVLKQMSENYTSQSIASNAGVNSVGMPQMRYIAPVSSIGGGLKGSYLGNGKEYNPFKTMIEPKNSGEKYKSNNVDVYWSLRRTP